jgi:hypothetical protein
MNTSVLLPIPRPVDPSAEPRGGVAAEELQRITARAQVFAEQQRASSSAAMAASSAQWQASSLRAEEILQARAVSARAITVRAEGTRNLVLGLGLSFVGTIVIGSLLSTGGR